MKKFLPLLLLFFIYSLACQTNNKKDGHPVIVKLPPKNAIKDSANTSLTASVYDLKKPDQTWKLPDELVEVSGNTWIDANRLILIEDTHPLLYVVNISDKKAVLEKTVSFEQTDKAKVDIEDVATVGNEVYALWSHGVLFQIKDWNSKPQVKKIPTSLSKANNTEGLCYDPVTKQLLIACKDESGLEGEKKSAKAVYQFDRASEKLIEKPFLEIHKKDFNKLAGDVDFNPSAIAVHPVTHDIYLLSTRGSKCMAVFGRDGSLKSFQSFDKDLMPQPEGICFSPEGKLYISSEGRKGEPGNLFEFNPE